MTVLTECISSKINIHNITEEIKEASPKGILDEVFAKYCKYVRQYCKKNNINPL